MLKENAFVIAREKDELKEQFRKNPDEYKNFKIFRQDFFKKLEKIVSPIFFRTQKIIEEKLFQTEITHEISEDGCFFILKNDSCNSTFRLTCPGYTRVNIDIAHFCEHEEYKDKISMNIDEVTPEKISALLDDFIKTFQHL